MPSKRSLLLLLTLLDSADTPKGVLTPKLASATVNDNLSGRLIALHYSLDRGGVAFYALPNYNLTCRV